MNKFIKGEQAFVVIRKYDDRIGVDVHHVIPVKIVSSGSKRLVYEWEGLRYSIYMHSSEANNIHDNFGDAERVAMSYGGVYR